jgi:hypothetical protein
LVAQLLRVQGPLPGKAGKEVAAALGAPDGAVPAPVSPLGDEAELPKPLTKTGVKEFVVEPLPSAP